MKKYKYIFVIVTYKNGEDLYDFNKSIEKKNIDSKVIIVDNFESESSSNRIKEISNELAYDYISTNNGGYGSGNNKGMKYALDNYDFDYLIVCNSDIMISEFDDSRLETKNYVFGPSIITIDGKRQNPYWVKDSKILKYLMYKGRIKRSYFLMYVNIIINKVYRELFLMLNRNKIKKVFAVHGAFVGFSKDVVEKLYPVYDEKMFLYNEEAYLATRLKKENIICVYYPLISINHKEDGSTGGKVKNINAITTKSYIYYYETYCKKVKK